MRFVRERDSTTLIFAISMTVILVVIIGFCIFLYTKIQLIMLLYQLAAKVVFDKPMVYGVGVIVSQLAGHYFNVTNNTLIDRYSSCS